MTFKVKDGVVVGSTTALDANGKLATGFSTARTIALSGDVTGSATFDGTANATIVATIAADSVALGTDTTGNYVASLVAGTGISVGAAGEGATPTITNTAPNVTTDISITHNTGSVVVNSSDGLDGTINAATTTLAGVMSSTDKTKLDGIASGATANTGTVTSVSGTGSYGGLSLSGTVTSSGSLTLGGTPTGTWPISVSGNAATLGGYSLAQTIPYHSGSDFVNGTLVTTSIPATAANGASFVIEVTGKGYGADVINLMAEGYLYNSTIINYDALDIGGGFSTNLYMIENGGYLCFWWARMSYWQSFSVKVRDAGGSSANTVTNITDVALPSYTKGVIVTPKKVLNSSNYNSYSPTLTGTGASGTWGISISGNAATVSSITSSQVTTALGYTPYNSTNPNGYITSSASITGSSGSVSGLTLTSSANGINPDNVTQNQLGYNTSISLFGQSDGGLYSSAHSSNWIHQIYGDFRTGQIAIRGKNSGTWQAWRTVLDSGNYTGYFADYTSGAYRVIADYNGINTWYIRSNGRFTWARGHDWTQAFELNLSNGTSGSNNGWALFGQNTSNSAAGTWYGTRFVQYTGSTMVDGYIRSGRYYLADDTNYMTNAGDGSMRIQTAYGYIDIGPKNNSWCHIYSDKNFYTNQGIWIYGHRVMNEDEWIGSKYDGSDGTRYAGSSFRAPIFYDYDNTGYYIDPASTSSLNAAEVYGGWHFRSNMGSNVYSGNTNTPPLQAYCNDNGTAMLSFHRAGLYAVNMGLDPDNVLRIGGWSASSNRFQMDMSGNLTMAGNVTAYSDERLKEDWEELKSDYVEKLATIKSGTYTRIDTKERQAGASAQDWNNLLPEVISKDNEGYLSLAYGNAALVSAIELAKRVIDQENRITKLEALIQQLI